MPKSTTETPPTPEQIAETAKYLKFQSPPEKEKISQKDLQYVGHSNIAIARRVGITQKQVKSIKSNLKKHESKPKGRRKKDFSQEG